ncbi:hypothetical protein COCSUDRAFT_24120 [Coccomyxa subellipsoidea C-169]|uniref:HVA22-like protein n=1 Tax=Coccomyxa subellipsoidea (strain C-169) TaxID=574566 RepID=I0YX03_COCSC|nr:hypothetical protein COCSUDRAFT_24120 [Coccomyxa subellipsoidea C-169]EIE22922.1 hypothetical protein COCSUDRAFT_24120 [Coccomyxa subellipsoidea C-169]|eukprot:XP_005647466.1 hypothetical protein COCSUDRAFT_24120 [Coccomyxa subellipsoidea C-169]
MFSFGLFYWLSHFLGFLYPTYASYKALMTPGTSDDTHWLTYWVVFSAMETAEAVIEQLMWIPFYYEIKCLLILWLVLPQTKGAQLVFEKFIVPFLKQYASHIDPIFKTTDQVLNSQQMASAAKLAQQYGPGIAAQAMQAAQAEAKRLAAAQSQAR